MEVLDPILSILLDASGNPFVAIDQYDAAISIYVRYWNGASWATLGQDMLDINAASQAFFPQIATDSAGNPSVVWFERDPDPYYSHVYVKRYTP